MIFKKTAIAAFGLVALIAVRPARGQDTVSCFDDTPPSPDGVQNPGCANPAICPTGAGLTGAVWMGGQIVSYFTRDDVGPCDTPLAYETNRCEDPRATCISNVQGTAERCRINLVGVLYKPSPSASSRKHAPAVVLVPGSTDCSPLFSQCVYIPGAFCGLKTYLLDHGYVVLEALPRGYGVNPFFQSTGLYVGNLAPQQVLRGDGCTIGQTMPLETCSIFDLEDEGTQDIPKAIEYLQNRPYVAPDRIAVLGYSFGAIRTLALNSIDFGQKAVVAMAPDSESWCVSEGGAYDTPFQTELFNDVDAAHAPIYFLQTRNDVNLNPTVEFSHEAGLNRQNFQAAIFPRARDVNGNPLPYGNWAHGCFIDSQDEVDVWAPSVVDFIRRYGVK